MSLHINTGDVIGVFVAGEWFDVERGSFRIGTYAFADTTAEDGENVEPVLHTGSEQGFEFVSRSKSRDVFAGPLSSIIAVQRAGEEPTAQGSLQRLAIMLRGEIAGSAVHFAHAGRLFELTFGPKGWTCSSRDGGTYTSDHYPLRQDGRPEEIASLVMADLKATFGRGR